jgi:hypothetical protein
MNKNIEVKHFCTICENEVTLGNVGFIDDYFLCIDCLRKARESLNSYGLQRWMEKPEKFR